ncbi:Zinc finger, CCHC-type superfamily [Sesbania bispinosa]|nr:Zinc finger, CCHC-type superfamily [Sesbania bispinosa]
MSCCLRGSSGGNVRDGKVIQLSEHQLVVCLKSGDNHRGPCLQGQGRCYYCTRLGHMAKDFPKKKRKVETQASSSQEDHHP